MKPLGRWTGLLTATQRKAIWELAVAEVWLDPRYEPMVSGPLEATKALEEYLHLDPRTLYGHEVHWAYAVKMMCLASDKEAIGATDDLVSIWNASAEAFIRAGAYRHLERKLAALEGLAAVYDHLDQELARRTRKEIVDLAVGRKLSPRGKEMLESARRYAAGPPPASGHRRPGGAVYLVAGAEGESKCQAVIFIDAHRAEASILTCEPRLRPALQSSLQALEDNELYRRLGAKAGIYTAAVMSQWIRIPNLRPIGPLQGIRTQDARIASYFAQQAQGKSVREARALFADPQVSSPEGATLAQ